MKNQNPLGSISILIDSTRMFLLGGRVANLGKEGLSDYNE